MKFYISIDALEETCPWFQRKMSFKNREKTLQVKLFGIFSLSGFQGKECTSHFLHQQTSHKKLSMETLIEEIQQVVIEKNDLKNNYSEHFLANFVYHFSDESHKTQET